VALQFKHSQVDDVLKSMVVLDLGKGRVGAVSYNSSAPPSARLNDIPFSIESGEAAGKQGGLAAVLKQLQGAHVAVNAGSTSLRADVVASRSGAHRKALITSTSVRTWELDRTPDLVDLVSAARDNGHEVLLIERPMPDAVSIAALGKTFDLVAAKGGVALEDATGKVVDFEAGDDRLRAA